MFEGFHFGKAARRRAVARLERRLHRRAVRVWEEVLGDGPCLPLQRFDPSAIEDRLDQGFLLDLRDVAAPTFARVAPVLQDEAGIEGEKIFVAEVPAGSLLARFAAHYPKALDTGRPVMAEYDFVTDAGWRVLCRGALLPLSSDGERVDHVYGVISWKSEKLREEVAA